MKRAIALSLFLVFGLGAILPFVSDYAQAGAHKKHEKHKKHRKYKKYSKQWWRAYYRRQARNNALVAQRRSLRLHQIRLENAVKSAANGDGTLTVVASKNKTKVVLENVTAPALLPSGEEAPKGWRRGATSSPAELQFNVDDENGANVGSTSIAVVGPALVANGGTKTVGGVQTSSLRRTVIDRMIREEGWVVNDYQKEIGGKKVFVVVAQSPGAGGSVQSRLFYFTEVGGQIYSVATSAPNGKSQRIEQESEGVIASFGQRRANSAVQQAELK